MPDKPQDHEIRELSRALPIPDALYPCSADGCRTKYTWPAFDLAWFSGRQEDIDPKDESLKVHAVKAGWYCPLCRDHLEIECDGPSLSETFATRTDSKRKEPDGSDPERQTR